MGLVGGIIWALFVATALWPPFRHGQLGFVCFLLTMVVNEVPLVFLVLVAVSATAPGSSADVAAWLSLPLFVFVVIGLLALQVRALTTRPTLERALDAELGADPDRIVLVGSSAGAPLAASAALTANDPLLQPGFEDADTTVAAVVSLYGYLGPRTADPSSAPTSLIHPCSPPFLLIEGGNDTALPPGVAAAFSTALREVSASPVVRAVLPGAQHNFDWFASVRARGVAYGVEAFLDWSRTQPLPS